jgi:hypothetical protein
MITVERSAMMTIHELVREVEDRKERNASIDDLRDEILVELWRARDQLSPKGYFISWVKFLSSNASIAESELKHTGLKAEQFDALAQAARNLGMINAGI